MCTEHPAVDGEHPGAEYQKSENYIADYLTHEDNKVFDVQSLIFVGVPEKVYCSNEKYKVLKIIYRYLMLKLVKAKLRKLNKMETFFQFTNSVNDPP